MTGTRSVPLVAVLLLGVGSIAQALGLTTVFATRDPARFGLARVVLASAGISFATKGESSGGARRLGLAPAFSTQAAG